MSITRLFLHGLGIALIATGQTGPAAPEEVRIRSAVYAPPGLTLAAQANLVELAVTVRDANGQSVGGLRKEDFDVFDGGERQTISVFSANTAAKPADTAANPDGPTNSAGYLALFFDDVHSTSSALQNARNAVTQFLNSSIEPGDHVGIFTTSGVVTVDFTTDRQLLAASLARLRPHPAGARAVAVCPDIGEFESYAIARNIDASIKNEAVQRAIVCNCPPPSDPAYADCVSRQPAVVQSTAEMLWEHFRPSSGVALEVLGMVVRHLARAPGRRVLLMLSPGLILDRREKQTSAIVDTALRGQIVIHGIDAAGLQVERRFGARQLVLEELMANLARSTGGRLFHNSNDVAGGIRAATATPENSYLLGFAPTREPDDAFHPLKVRLTAGGSRRIEARPGYFAAAAQKESIQQRLDRLASSEERHDEFPVHVIAAPGPQRDGRYPIHVEARVDAKALKFPQQQGRSVQQLTFVTLLEDASGAYITGRQSVMDLMLTSPKLAGLKRDGIKAGLTFYAPKGRYRLRQLVREAAQDRITATSIVFEIQ